MITIRNRQRTILCNLDRMKNDVALILQKLGYSDFDLGILITNDRTMREYNRQYRNIDKPTDVLSFPFHANVKAGRRIKPTCEEEKNLGDLIISAPYVARGSAELKVPLEDRLRVLLVHSIFHLLGYDHITDTDYRRMRSRERAMLRYLSSAEEK